ncbi:MAG: hypothetical protein JWQ79_3107 [Mucilaginibacter sp.]|nr:hypothetical protein [Mucilaginibacter sp.]
MSFTDDIKKGLNPEMQVLADSDELFDNQPVADGTEFGFLVEYLRNEACNDSGKALKAVNEAEGILQQAYTGRYLFELIQNVRDANKAAGINGKVFIEVSRDILTISNTGAGFTRKGLRSITTIGDSTKDSKDFIGFKGIGFKSVQEISDTPRIVTAFGTIVFDRALSYQYISRKVRNIKNVPLFFIPHYLPETLSAEEISQNISTKIVLPLKAGENESTVSKSFKFIKSYQLLLLGSIKLLDFRSATEHAFFEITDYPKIGRVTLETEKEFLEFKRFAPGYEIKILSEKLKGLTDKEREIYEKDPHVDIVFLFDNEEKRLQPIPNATLFLFNPLKIRSGFNFLIHSYFIVNAERTELRDNLLNEFLLTSIADYLTGDWLKFAMRAHDTVYLDFLAFDRNREAPILNTLYNRVIDNLKFKEFIYDRITGKRYRYDQVIIGDGFDKGLFENNRIGDKQIIYIKEKATLNWLTNEMHIEYLDGPMIREHLEQECVRQRKKENYAFFERLYKYMANTTGIDFSGLKILLTSENVLRSDKENVFYGLAEQKRGPLPTSIRKRIYFNHPNITIKKFREGNGTGFLEYKTDMLARKLLTLFSNPKVPNKEILNTLLDLPFSETLIPILRARILLPLKSGEWVKPLFKAVYMPSDELRYLYQGKDFLDTDMIPGLSRNRAEITSKLLTLGAWDIPALIFKDTPTTILQKDERFQLLLAIHWFSTPYMQTTGDWLLDKPSETNEWFSQVIIKNWQRYILFMQRPEHPDVKFKSENSQHKPISKSQLIPITDFVYKLRHDKWLHTGPGSLPFAVNEVVAIDNTEYNLPVSAHFKRYLKAFKLNYVLNADFIRMTGICHLDGYGLQIWKNILSGIAKDYAALDVDPKDFTFFYHKIYGKLFDFYENRLVEKDSIKELKTIKWLAINDLSQLLEWQTGSKIFNLDDKSGYDILPEKIKSVVQPQFTLREKNRFGQIARLIGISFRREIDQRLEPGVVLREIRLSEFIPHLPEVIALVETNLNADFEKDLEKIRNTVVREMQTITVQIYVRKIFVQMLPVPYKVETGKTNVLYAIKKPDVNTASFFASALHDYLVEILNRDLQKSKNLLLDFFSRENKSEFLRNYEVEDDRLEGIREKLIGHQLSAAQRFWVDLLSVKNIDEPLKFITDDDVLLDNIASALLIPFDQLSALALQIDFNRINDPSVIQPVNALFTLLRINLLAYNQISLSPFDFSNYYLEKFVYLLAKHKKIFESKLFQFLNTKNITSQSEFQSLLRKYNALKLQITPPVLIFDLNAVFIKQINTVTYGLKLSFNDLNNVQSVDTRQLYHANLITLQTNLKLQNIPFDRLEAFLDDGAQRSLVYFGQLDEVSKRYIKWLDQFKDSGNSEEEDEESAAHTDTGKPTIEDTKTDKVDVPEKKGYDGTGWTNGKRMDGGAPSPQNDRIGRSAERYVFDTLRLDHKNVEWVSRNAARAGVNPEGSDEFGYDISFMDDNDQIHYVEVKGNSAFQKHFYISRFEINLAKSKKDFYHVYYVPYALEKTRRKIQNLGNIFLFGGTDDLFNNQKFTATYDILEISFS